jgi:hypothetical protein
MIATCVRSDVDITRGRSREYGRTERCDWGMPGEDAGPDV